MSAEATPPALRDRQTVRRLFERDHRALLDLFDLHSDSVYSVALAETGDRQVAGEITRRVFVRLWHERYEFVADLGFPQSIRVWLRTAAHQEATAWLRRGAAANGEGIGGLDGR